MTSVRGLPVEQAERYVTRLELARLLGVSVDTVDRMVRAGCPSEVFGVRSRRFLASRAVAWARERERRAA